MASTTDITLSHIGLLSNLKTTDKSNIVNAINEIKSDIPTIGYINNAVRINTSTALSYTGLYATIPSHSYFVINCRLAFNNSPARSVAISSTISSPSIYDILANASAIDNYATCTAVAMTGDSSLNLYMFASSTAVASNDVSMWGFYIKVE